MTTQRNMNIAIILALVVVALFIALGFFGVRGFNVGQQELSGPQDILEELQTTGTVAELRLFDITEGNGDMAKSGDVVVVNYNGVLPDGTKFDSSYDRGEPFIFQLGAGQVIRGWEQGFEDMKVGGRRLIVIPPELGYGSADIGSIPANSTLIFEVELLQILPPEVLEAEVNTEVEAQ